MFNKLGDYIENNTAIVLLMIAFLSLFIVGIILMFWFAK